MATGIWLSRQFGLRQAAADRQPVKDHEAERDLHIVHQGFRQVATEAVALPLKKTFEPIEPGKGCLDVAIGALEVHLFRGPMYDTLHTNG